jgi:hypothetical protein
MEKGMTIKEATERFVGQMSRVPQPIIAKLLQANGPEEVEEITPPSCYDRVYITDGDYYGQQGEILRHFTDEETENELYEIELGYTENDGRVKISLPSESFEVLRDDYLPMWGTMWAFDDSIDNWWLEEKDGLQKMADCGFRIYRQEDYEYLFGIDGAGYDFWEAHWIPLYKARGFHWHDPETEK